MQSAPSGVSGAMKTAKLILLAAILATVALAGTAPGNAAAAAYRHYVACGVGVKAKPAHVCPQRAKKGAFFKSRLRDVHYTVCMRLPGGRSICAKRQVAEQGVLYVNKITSSVAGRHRVTWFVKGKRVGSFVLRVRA